MSIITLITDYGIRDHYVGSIKGVICSICPNARIVDITHDIDPHDVLHGAFVLRHSFPWYPDGTVHLVVVDPGVGSKRRMIAGQYGKSFVVAPDNGLITLLYREIAPAAVHFLEERRFSLPTVSATFQGRDVMAPAAAHLASGVGLGEFGPPAEELQMLSIPHNAESMTSGFKGCVLFVDRFGTLITNVDSRQLAKPRVRRGDAEVLVNGVSLGPIRSSYAEVAAGEPVALIGGTGMLEVAINQGSASKHFGPVDEVSIEVRF